MELALKLIVGILVGLFGAMVTLDLYNWFILPFGAPSITFWHMYGLLLIKGLMMYTIRTRTPDENEWEVLTQGTIMYLFSWGLGYLAASLM